MDIDILLLLQEFRNDVGAFLAEFLSKMTYFGEVNTVLIIMALIYWDINKDFGTYLLMGWNGNRLVNGMLKITACVYRPWIRDPRIVPYGDSMQTATGYSFPSGHTMNASTVYNGVAVRNDMPVILRVFMIVIVSAVGFSRMYLGVHTPQDVLVGAGAGTLVMWLTFKLVRWLKDHPEKDMTIMWIGIGLAAALAVYAAVKPYPVDFNAEGKILVDGAKMANDTFKGVGWCIAFFVGWIMERRFVKFSTDVPMLTRIVRIVVGLFNYYVISLIIIPLLKTGISGPAGTIITCFIQMFYIVFIFPWMVKHLEKKINLSKSTETDGKLKTSES